MVQLELLTLAGLDSAEGFTLPPLKEAPSSEEGLAWGLNKILI